MGAQRRAELQQACAYIGFTSCDVVGSLELQVLPTRGYSWHCLLCWLSVCCADVRDSATAGRRGAAMGH